MSNIIFTTEHFIIRQCTMADAQDIVVFWNDPEVMKYIGDGTWSGGIAVVNDLLKKYIDAYQKHPSLGDWAVVDKQTNSVIGEASLEPTSNNNEFEAGYVLRKDYWGKGFATEILRGLIAYGFSHAECRSIMAITMPANLASIKVMEKCDMHFDGQHMYYGLPHYKYVIEK